MFGDKQEVSLEDYKAAAVQLKYNKRSTQFVIKWIHGISRMKSLFEQNNFKLNRSFLCLTLKIWMMINKVHSFKLQFWLKFQSVMSLKKHNVINVIYSINSHELLGLDTI